jgi:hypothetical protein
MEYRINELSLTLPGDGWEDSSIHRLHHPMPDGEEISFEIVRAQATPSGGLAARVDSDIEGHRRHLRGFELLERQSFERAGVRGASTTFRTVTPDGALYHEVAYVPLSDVLMVFRASTTTANASACREVIRAVVESFDLRAGDAGSPR